jgi:hypothetical protein
MTSIRQYEQHVNEFPRLSPNDETRMTTHPKQNRKHLQVYLVEEDRTHLGAHCSHHFLRHPAISRRIDFSLLESRSDLLFGQRSSRRKRKPFIAFLNFSNTIAPGILIYCILFGGSSSNYLAACYPFLHIRLFLLFLIAATGRLAMLQFWETQSEKHRIVSLEEKSRVAWKRNGRKEVSNIGRNGATKKSILVISSLRDLILTSSIGLHISPFWIRVGLYPVPDGFWFFGSPKGSWLVARRAEDVSGPGRDELHVGCTAFCSRCCVGGWSFCSSHARDIAFSWLSLVFLSCF